MITFSQHLSESLSSSFPIIRSDTRERESYVANTTEFKDNDGNHYEVIMRVSEDFKGRQVLNLDFTSNDRLTRTDVRQSSNAMKVYSTIGNELRKFVAKYPADLIVFSAADTRMIGVYNRLGARIAKELGGKFTPGLNISSVFIIYLK